VAAKVRFELAHGHPVDPRRAPVADYRSQGLFKALLGDHLFHQFFVHCFLS
jgi:hypothetical protein